MFHRGSSPSLDISDFPTLRRVRPLPKRRRSHDPHDEDVITIPPLPASALQDIAPLTMPGPDATAEELLAHAEQLSAQMALQSYYMPILGGVQDLLRNSINGNLDEYTSARLSQAISLGVDYMTGHAQQQQHDRTLGGEDEEDEEDGRAHDGDFVDHLQQPGNTKKRKVPTNMTGSRHHDPGEEDGDIGDLTTAAPPDGRNDGAGFNYPNSSASYSSSNAHSSSHFLRKGKLSAVTRAGLKHKEMLKARKRQLAAVLDALSLGNTFALDQALSSSYFAAYRADDPKRLDSIPVRLSKRYGPRMARAARKAMYPPHPDRKPLPECQFSFTYESATSKRVIATKEEVAMLHSRFEAELARQAAKAAKLAASSKTPGNGTGSRTGRSKRDRGRARTKNDGHQNAEFLDPNQPSPLSAPSQQSLSSNKDISGGIGQGNGASGGGTGTAGKPRGKKKKRSALANASNPHHLRNYVPSRLPHTTPSQHQNSNNELGPLPIRFLSADIGSSKVRGGGSISQQHNTTSSGGTNPMNHGGTTATAAGGGMTQLTNPFDEWVCAYCEYELFFGDESDFRRAIRNRKKILKRRRRAMERAAAAASGQKKAFGGHGGGGGRVDDMRSVDEEGEDEDDYESESELNVAGVGRGNVAGGGGGGGGQRWRGGGADLGAFG